MDSQHLKGSAPRSYGFGIFKIWGEALAPRNLKIFWENAGNPQPWARFETTSRYSDVLERGLDYLQTLTTDKELHHKKNLSQGGRSPDWKSNPGHEWVALIPQTE